MSQREIYAETVRDRWRNGPLTYKQAFSLLIRARMPEKAIAAFLVD